MTNKKPEWGTPEWHRQHSIFGVDFNKPPDKLIEEIRSKLVVLRGQLSDISRGYPGFKESLKNAESTLTLVISYLYYEREQIEKVFNKKDEG